jgi:hypothetical protein
MRKMFGDSSMNFKYEVIRDIYETLLDIGHNCRIEESDLDPDDDHYHYPRVAAVVVVGDIEYHCARVEFSDDATVNAITWKTGRRLTCVDNKITSVYQISDPTFPSRMINWLHDEISDFETMVGGYVTDVEKVKIRIDNDMHIMFPDGSELVIKNPTWNLLDQMTFSPNQCGDSRENVQADNLRTYNS